MESTARAPAERAAWATWSILAVGVLAASVSAILIRYADEAHPFAISFWRCAAGSLALAPFGLRGFKRMSRADLKPPIVAGLFLSVHFATWIMSIDLTSVASAVLLVSTTPVFVALAARFLYDERLPGSGWAGIVIALAGTGLISAGGGFEGGSFRGDLLALIGGATVAGYALAGRRSLREIGIVEYAAVTYAVAALALLVLCLVAGVGLAGYSDQTWWALAGLIVGPQLLGHTLINASLKDIDATTVSVTIMAEPVIAIILAYLLFDEVPSVLLYPSGVAILAGIYLVSTARKEPPVILE